MKIPYEDLSRSNLPYMDEMRTESSKVINSGWYILGENVSNFENEFATYNNSEFCLGVASGLDALILGLSVFDFPLGSKVLVPSNTYIATILAILRSGLKPVLVEPDWLTCNINVKGLSDTICDDCVAIIVVHLYGRLCDMGPIIEFAKERNLKIIEDCAQSHFSKDSDTHAGNFGDIGAFSFYPTKNLGALGDAGAIVCKDKEVYLKLKALRNYGSHKKYYNNYLGWNSRLDEIQASFLRIKLKDIHRINKRKRVLAERYLNLLSGIPDLILPAASKSNNVWHIFNVRTNKRNELKQYLLECGIGSEIHYPVAPSEQIAYKKLFGDYEYPIALKIHNQTLSLPIAAWLNDSDVDYICEKISSFFNN